MTFQDALDILAANDAVGEDSFLDALHERDSFDVPAFWQLFGAMSVIAAVDPDARGAQTHEQAAHVYHQILKHIIYHFSPYDQSEIDDLPGEALQGYLDRLAWVFDPVIMGKRGYGPTPDFDDGLREPE